MKWTLVSYPWSQKAAAREVRTAQARKLTFRLKEPHALAFSLRGESEDALSIEELYSDCTMYLHDGVSLTEIFRGRCGTIIDRADATNHESTYTFLDYRAVLQRREFRPGVQVSYNATQLSIITSLLNIIQARTNGSYGITASLQAGSDQVREMNWEPGDDIYTAITFMSNLDPGFEWEVDPLMSLKIWITKRGVSSGQFLEWGRSVISFERSRPAATYSNDNLNTGDLDTTPVRKQSATIATDPRGRWDGTYSFVGVKIQETLQSHADRGILRSTQLTGEYWVTLRQNWWKGPAHIWIGDTVDLRIRSGRIQDVMSMRVLEIEVGLGENNDEIVRMKLGAAA